MSAGPIRYLPRQAGTSVSVRIVNGAMRASVGSIEASDGRLARVGRIDRSIQDVSSRPDMLCTFVTLDS